MLTAERRFEGTRRLRLHGKQYAKQEIYVQFFYGGSLLRAGFSIGLFFDLQDG
jgi:hypothetical protein